MVHIQKNLDGVSEVSIQSTVPQYGLSFSMVMSTGIKGVVRSLAIPHTLFPANFKTTKLSVYVSPADSFAGTLK